MKWEKLLHMLQFLMFGPPPDKKARAAGRPILRVQSPGRGSPSDPQVLILLHPKALGRPCRGPHIDAIAKLKQQTFHSVWHTIAGVIMSSNLVVEGVWSAVSNSASQLNELMHSIHATSCSVSS